MTNQIKLTLHPGSSFLLGGVTVNPAYDSVTALDENNLPYLTATALKGALPESRVRCQLCLPYLTATALKGALRIEFEALVRGIGEEKLCDFDTDIRGCTDCLSCRLFGGGNEEGKLRFNAAFLENPGEVLPKEVRQDLLEKGAREGVSISRTLGKAKEKAYFTKLAFPDMKKIKEISFTTGIDIRQELDKTERKYLEMFLKYLERTGIFMGARKSVGLGYFTQRVNNVFVPEESHNRAVIFIQGGQMVAQTVFFIYQMFRDNFGVFNKGFIFKYFGKQLIG